jgi:hypothetical protein
MAAIEGTACHQHGVDMRQRFRLIGFYPCKRLAIVTLHAVYPFGEVRIQGDSGCIAGERENGIGLQQW